LYPSLITNRSHTPLLYSICSVRPPKKTWKIISNLSGGEKTLSSLALVFALHYYKPTPLYVMDEIDAALDFKNVSIVGHYIKVCDGREVRRRSICFTNFLCFGKGQDFLFGYCCL
jgi:ABC-type iron transport system FetAB ATPase subunit